MHRRSTVKRSRIAGLLTLAVWVGAFLVAGLPGLACAIVGGLVMSIGTLVNAGLFPQPRESDVSSALRRYGESLR